MVGAAYLAAGNPVKALARYADMEKQLTAHPRSDDTQLLTSLGIASALVQLERYREAQARLDAMRDAAQRSRFQVESVGLLDCLIAVRDGHSAGAVARLDAIVAVRERTYGNDSVLTAEAHLARAEALEATGRGSESTTETPALGPY